MEIFKGKKNTIGKILCLLFALTLVFQTVSPVFAFTGDTVKNDADKNLTILDKLQSLYGDNLTEKSIEKELASMGLLDEDGNINVNESVMVDGKTMTLPQVKEMLNAEDLNLGSVVCVDGTSLTLGDLKKIIEIEDELARIKAKYFSNVVPLTEEHKKSLASLINQIETSGITIQSGIQAAGAEIAINHNARIKVKNLNPTYTMGTSKQNIWMEFWLVDETGNPITLGYDVKFDWRLLNGSAIKGTHYNSKAIYAPEGTVTIPRGYSNIPASLEISNIINYLGSFQDTTNTYKNPLNRWQEDKIFLIQLFNPVNILFEGGTLTKDIPVTLYNSYRWTVSLSQTLASRSIPVTDSIPHFTYSFVYDKIKDAAIDIFGSVANACFQVNMSGKLLSTDINEYKMTAKPQYLDESGNVITDDKFISGGEDWYTVPISREYTIFAATDNNPEDHSTPYYARIFGALPSEFRYSNATYTPSAYPSTQMNYKDRVIDVNIFDTVKPEVKNISAPAGSYYSGQVIPVTVEFSEPVKIQDLKLYMQGEDTGISPAESLATVSKYATFMYTVPKSPNNSLVISSVKNINGLVDTLIGGVYINRTSSWPSDMHLTTIPDLTMSIDTISAFNNVSINNIPSSGLYAPSDNIEVKVSVDRDVSGWLENDYDINEKHLKTVYIKAGGITYPLVMGGEVAEEGSYYTALIPAKNYAGLTQKNLTIELYTGGTYTPTANDVPAYFTGGALVIGKYVSASLDALVLAQSVTLDTNTYPANNIIYLTDDKIIQFNASVSPDTANYKSIKWQSSDTAIALIDETTGVVTPVKQGTVTFKAVADNGGVGTPVYAETPQFTVADGGTPAILFPKGNNAFVTKKNETANIVWGQNLIGRTANVPVEFSVGIYDGITSVYSTTVTDTNTCTVPTNVLSKVSSGSDPAYTVQVSAVNPDNSAQTLSATGYIIVYPKPAVVTLNKLDSYYITDETTTLNIGWTLSEFNSGEFEFKVVKNQNAIYTSTINSGSYTLPIDTVPSGFLKDIYTVSVKAKNTQDNAWSTDSFVLNVYSKNSLKLKVDGKESDSLTMDNNAKIKEIYDSTGSRGILSLKRDINLKNNIGINHEDYPWGSITDQIKWKSDNSNTASVNYRQGTLYENIEKFSYSAYRPATEFMLAGNSGGTTKITATHAATGMVDTIDVNVKTLKDKLYLFSFYPKQTVELTYKNGSGESRTLYTDEIGEIAIYEESGIASDISLKAGSDSGLYLGTLYKENLVSGEKDPGIYELYPVNTFKLRPAARVELFFKDKDGNPYTGKVTYRGAVYKNDGICSQTMESNGKELTIGSDGRFTLIFDTTKFWVENNTEKLQGYDKLEFIYEVLTADGSYYPQLINVNGSLSMEDAVRFGESVINLTPVEDNNKNKPFIESQAIDYHLKNGRTIEVNQGSIGPSNIYKTADLETLVAWWGMDKTDGYDVKVEDGFGGQIEGQRVKTILYPFATMAYTKNITTLSEASLNLKLGEKKGGAVSFYNPSGTLLKNVLCPFTFINMVGAPEADDDANGVKQAASDMKNIGEKGFDFNENMSGGNKIISLALKALSDGGIAYGDFSLYVNIAATEDPLVYRGIITKKLQLNSADTDDVSVDIGGADTSFEYGYDPEKMTSVAYNLVNSVLEPPSPVSANIDTGMKLAGYFEVEARYDTAEGKWVLTVMGGGLDLDALFGASTTLNGMVGPIPVTASLGIGAATNLKFRAVKPYGNVPSGVKAADVNDFFTQLRIKAYVSAFGGLGFDYSLVALKIGVFGKANLDYNAEFVNKPYMIPGDGLYAYLTTLGISGQVGVKFVATILHISYETVLASVEGGTDFWVEGEQYRSRLEEWKNQQTSSLFSPSKSMSANLMGAATSLKTVKESTGYESRDYLKLYDRSWGRKFLLGKIMLASSGTNDIQNNSYPYSNPVVTRDGEIMAYMSDSDSADLNETRASWAVKGSAGYEDQGAFPQIISQDSFADSNIAIDGTKSFAAAAWEHQSIKIDSSSTPTAENISAMINSSEIAASIYDGSKWTTTLLTGNMVSDMAPVVAVNGGRAVVAWRSLTGSGIGVDGLLNADVHDSIMYKVYENGSWSEAYTLYNGTSGNVKGLSAAMMKDGTSGIAYTLDYGKDGSNSTYGYETICAVIGGDNSMKADIRLTNNDSTDLNPQITVAGSDSEGYKFITGWYNATSSGTTDIKLAAVDKDGKVDSRFIDSVNSVYENSEANITSKFRFAKKENAGIEDLSILWVQPNIMYDESTDNTAQNDSLKAVKFMVNDNGGIYLTAALDVADMEQYTLIDHFDAYSDTENNVTAVMLASSYTGKLQDQGNQVYTVDSICSMKSAQAQFKNDINLKEIYFNYKEVKSGFKLPITLTVTNMGITPVSSIKVKIAPDNVTKTFDNLSLLPNQSIVLTVDYDVPESDIHDLDYEVTAEFTNGDSAGGSGSLDIDVPDTGISKVELISDEQGKRVIQATLHNSSDVKLAGSGRKVYAGFYTSPMFTDASKVEVQEIAGDELNLLDNGALTMRFTYTVPAEGIPQGGTRLYGREWVEEYKNGAWSEVNEYQPNDNTRSILLQNLIEANNGNQFAVYVEQENDQATKAYVTVKNLSMSPSSNGNVIVKLLDNAENVIETKFIAATSADLLALKGEESVTKEILFTELGRRVVAEYFTADPSDITQEISDISLSGINMNFDKEVKDYHLTANNLNNTLITALAKNSEDTVEIRSSDGSTLLASGTGAALYDWQLKNGQTSKVQIKISGDSSYVYNIDVTSVQKSSGTVILNVPENNFGNAKVYVSAVELRDFVPLKWQYVKNGVWTDKMDWNPAESNSIVIKGAGTYTIAARLIDASGYYIDSNSIAVIVKKSGGGSSTGTTTYSADVSGKSKFTLPVTLNKNVAEVDLGTLTEDKFETSTEITMPAIPGVDSYIIGIPADYLSSTDGKETLTFTTSTGRITISTDMLAVLSVSQGNKAKITFRQGDKSGLADSAKSAIGDRPLIQLTLTLDGKQIEWNNPNSPIKVTIPYVPTEEEQKYPESIVVWYIDDAGNAVPVPNGHYDPTSGTVTFLTTHFSCFAVGYNQVRFADVAESAWYNQAVAFAAARGITTGTGNGNYSPDEKLTRGDFLVMLMKSYNMTADTNLADNFSDAGNTYYTGYLAAAKRLGISSGVGGNMFAPDKEITRQEMFTLLYNTLSSINMLPEGKNGKTLSNFSDNMDIAAWAKDAMTQFVGTGTINGSDGRLLPTNTTTRAEMVQVFYNLLSKYT